MKIPITLFAPHTLRLKPDAAGEFLAEAKDDGFVVTDVHGAHHAVISDAGLASFVAHLPSAEIFVGPLQVSAMPVNHVTHAFTPMPVSHASGFVASPLAAAAPPPPPTLSQSQVDMLATGFANTLSGLESNLIAQVFAQNLPVLGDNLAAAAGGGVAQLHYLAALKTALVDNGLNTLTGSATYSEAQVELAMNTALSAAGMSAGAGVDLNLANLSDIKVTVSSAKSFAAFTAPLEANLGLPGLGIQTTGSASSTIGYGFNFNVGLDGTGFYLNAAPGNSIFNASLDTKIPGFSASAQLGPLRFTASDLAGPSATDFNGTFAITLKDPNNDGHLRAGELGGDLLDATVTGNAAVRLHLASDLGSAVLPDIGADLNFSWGFSSAVVNPAAGQVSFGNQPVVAFKNVSLGLGSFFSDFVNPVFGKLQLLTGPLQPLVDVLKTEIKPISDIAGAPVTIRSIAEITGALDQPTLDRLDLYVQLIGFINSVPGGVGNARIDLGDYNLGGLDLRAVAFQLANSIPAPIRNALAAGAQSPELQTFLNGKAALAGGGLSFPIIENPATAINLLLGKPVDFFTYHVPGLDFGPRGFDQFYPILGPLGVRLQGTVEAHAHLDVGYDSSGVAKFATTGLAGDILKGFYVVDQPGPEATLTGHLAAYGAFNVVFAEARVGGGLDANLNIFLNDNDSAPGDGRVHLAELGPGCLFSTSGELSAGVSAYLKVGWGPFSETFEKNFAHVTLLDFSGLGCDANGLDGGPVLAHLVGASVALHVGPDSVLRQIGSTTDGAEDFVVFHDAGGAGNEDVGVLGGGLLKPDGTPLAPQIYHAGANGRITADGGEKDDHLALALGVLTPATFHGGAGDDVLVGSGGWDVLSGDAGNDALIGGIGNDALNGGADQDYLDGQEDDDNLSGGSGSDLLIGGPGADALDGGAGYDTASYATATVGVVINLATGAGSNDAQGDTFISIERIVGSPFADILLGGNGNDNFAGGAGGDVIDGGGGDDLLTGDEGGDQLIGGAGNDFAAYTISPAAVNVSLFTGLGSGGDAAGDTLSGIENLQGSTNFGDTLEGDNGVNWLRGLNGANTLRGLGGDDLLEGGKDSDSLDGGDGSDTLKASLDLASIDLGISGGLDALLGGAGDDFLYGDAGGDVLDGGADADQIFGGKDGDTISGGAGDDIAYGGAGNDTISGGLGLDLLHGDEGVDLLDGGGGNDVLEGGIGNDTLLDLSGDNQLFGNADDDLLTAGTGNDLLDGGTGNDRLDAGDGTNFLTGGDGNDILISGSGGDNIHGNLGDDTATSGAGNDLVFGEDGNDLLDAGVGADRVDGGNGNDFLTVGALRVLVQDPDRLDHLFGGAGFDTITADFSNQTLAMVVTAGQTQSLVFADGAEARDFENVHDFFTGSGDDVLHLEGAADDHFGNLLKTGAGNDTIYSGAGSDNVDAGDGDDFVNGGSNDAVLTFGNFATVTGFTGPAETLAGGVGTDTLSFEGFFGTLPVNSSGVRLGVYINLSTNQTGGAAIGITISGFENITGTDYGDDLTGDDGPNIFEPLRGGGYTTSATTSGPDRIDGLGGEDTLRIDFSRADVANSLGIVTAGGGFYRNTIGNLATVDSYSYTSIEHLDITGASKDDSLYPVQYGFADTLRGLGGNDALGGFGGADTLLGGDGNDVLIGQGRFLIPSLPESGYDGIAGGHDVFDGGAGDDLLEDIAFGGGVLLSADALFQLDGGSGYDTLSADFSNQPAIVWDSATAANIDFADGAYFHNFEALRYFRTGSGNDSITQLGRVDNLFFLGAGDDSLNPGIGFDTVYGGAGNDLLILDYRDGDSPTALGINSSFDGFQGSYSRSEPVHNNRIDYITFREIERLQVTGGSHNDTLAGLPGDDTLIGGGGNDIINGAGGNNYLEGGDGNDTLTVGTGSNTMIGGAGDDLLTGSDGNELMFGDADNDTLILHKGSDTAYGGAGNDVILATDFTNGLGYGVDVIDAGDGDDLVVNGYFNGTGNSYATGVTRLQLNGGLGFDKLSADFGNQTQAITFIGGASNSADFADGSYFHSFEQLGTFISGSGNDAITQLGRVDNLFFLGAGDDSLNPGLGIDYIYGGAGDDTLILDYSVGDDANVSGVVFTGTFLERRDVNTNAYLDSIYTEGFEHFDITGGSKNDTLPGTNGADILRGGAGNDTLAGYDGNDTLDGGTGVDTMTGGAGNDTYIVDNIADVINEGAGGGYDTVIFTIGGPLTQPTNIEKIIFLQSTTLPSLDIGANGIVILGSAAPAPVPPALENAIATLAKITASTAHDTATDIAIAKPIAAFHEMFAPEFIIGADTTHDVWHPEATLHEAAHAPFDFDVMDAMV